MSNDPIKPDPREFVSYEESHSIVFKRQDGSTLQVAGGSVLAQELRAMVDTPPAPIEEESAQPDTLIN